MTERDCAPADDVARWGAATSAAGLRALVVEWLRGELRTTPWHCGGPATETGEIAGDLIALNEGGLMTDQSQPGEFGAGWAQRAHVSGYCSQEVADRIEAAVLATDLIVQVWPCGSDDSAYTVAVSRDDGGACTWAGGYSVEGVTEGFYRAGTTAVADVLTGFFIDVIDPVWGRNGCSGRLSWVPWPDSERGSRAIRNLRARPLPALG